MKAWWEDLQGGTEAHPPKLSTWVCFGGSMWLKKGRFTEERAISGHLPPTDKGN